MTNNISAILLKLQSHACFYIPKIESKNQQRIYLMALPIFINNVLLLVNVVPSVAVAGTAVPSVAPVAGTAVPSMAPVAGTAVSSVDPVANR